MSCSSVSGRGGIAYARDSLAVHTYMHIWHSYRLELGKQYVYRVCCSMSSHTCCSLSTASSHTLPLRIARITVRTQATSRAGL